MLMLMLMIASLVRIGLYFVSAKQKIIRGRGASNNLGILIAPVIFAGFHDHFPLYYVAVTPNFGKTILEMCHAIVPRWNEILRTCTRDKRGRISLRGIEAEDDGKEEKTRQFL